MDYFILSLNLLLYLRLFSGFMLLRLPSLFLDGDSYFPCNEKFALFFLSFCLERYCGGLFGLVLIGDLVINNLDSFFKDKC